MTRPLSRSPFRTVRRRGAMAVWCAVLTPIVLIVGVFASELAYMHLVRVELRTAVDASAHAGGRMLSLSQTPADAVQAAKDGARANSVAGRELLLADADIELGRAGPAASGRWAFDAAATPPNAVRVTGRRTAGSPTGAVPVLFAGVFDRRTFEPVKSAISVQVDRDIVLVHDRSGSMTWPVDQVSAGDPPGWSSGMAAPSGARWYDSVNAVDVFFAEIRRTPTTELIGLVTFATDATHEVDLTTDDTATTGVLAGYSAAYPGGATWIDYGLRQGVATLLDHGTGRPLADKLIVFMTDGRYNGPNSGDQCVADAAAAHARGVTVHAITFSAEADQVLMGRVAAAGGGRHWHATDAASLAAAYRAIAATVTTMLIE